MTQITKAALMTRIEALEKSLKQETELRKREAAERGRLEKALADSLKQQTATGEILRVISSSGTDVQPVFDAIIENATRLCEAFNGTVFRFDGSLIHLAATRNIAPEAVDIVRRVFPISPDRGTVTGRAILTRAVIHVPDLAGDLEHTYPELLETGFRAVLSVPMLRDGAPIGAITVSRREPRAFSDEQIALLQTFADQAVIAIENVRLFTELQEKNRALTVAHAQVTEALEQQTATSEILKVISQSQTDVQPVFDTIVQSAVRLCDGLFSSLFQFDGEMLHPGAMYNYTPEALEELHRVFPARPTRAFGVGRAILERASVPIPDVAADPDYQHHAAARAIGWRSGLFVPMLREDVPIGVIMVARAEPGPFSDNKVALLQTFADQAVIAIENVRLFTELQEKNVALTEAHGHVTEALEQQTATAEILHVIASSPTDVQPVFDTIVKSANRLCDGRFSAAIRYDGELMHFVAHANFNPEALEVAQKAFPRPPTPDVAVGQAILERAVVHIPDVTQAPAQIFQRSIGYRSVLAVPMLTEGRPIGAIAVTREEPWPLADAHITLLQTFAAQAVIAVENVRLFKELEARNRDLTEALDRQTATAEILRVISQSQTEVQPVFDTIVDNAIRLFRAWAVAAMRSDGQLLHLIAARGGTPGTEDYLRRQSPWPIQGPLPASRCVAHRTLIHIPDAESDPTLDQGIRDLARTRGWQSVLAAPMLRDGQPIGAITVTRAEPGPFSSAEVELLQTFADQAVIAVENARLLGELRARTSELTRSVQELTALGDVSRALSSTLDLDAILQTIVTRASELAGTDACSVFEYDAATEAFHLRATNNLDEEVVTLARQTPTRKGEGVQGRMALTRQPVQVPDIAEEDAYHGPLRDILLRTGTRAVLAIPMLREEELIGGLTVNKRSPGEFSSEVIELLTTFATQSALAIQNARLFREIADKSRQLEAASRHKSEFLANMSHELRTPLNAIIGFSEVLTERMFGELNDKQEEYLKDIYASGQHLLSLINDILDLSKIEAGRMELELNAFDLPTAIDNALILVRERAGRRGITLGRSIDQRVGVIHADERKVKQVLLNLLSNALKFTPEGGRVDVRATVVDGMAQVSVTDTGVGIAPEDQEAVFEEFRQVGTADKKVEGTGLGLSLARKFIELHGPVSSRCARGRASPSTGMPSVLQRRAKRANHAMREWTPSAIHRPHTRTTGGKTYDLDRRLSAAGHRG